MPPGPIDPTPLLSGLVERRIVVAAKDVVYVRGIFEASDGVAAVYSVAGGDLTLAATPSRVAELDQILADLACELGADMLTEASTAPHISK
ncbi:MAG: hypothetical protein RJA70_4002 [Pseudomonadota bacterium]|jgi:hypothetical protein